MINFPDIQLPSSFEESTEDPTIRSEMESGVVLSRPRFTRKRKSWVLSWANMRGAHYRILRDFNDQLHGGSLAFNWVHPKDLVTYKVRFKGKLSARHTVMDHYSINLTIEEI